MLNLDPYATIDNIEPKRGYWGKMADFSGQSELIINLSGVFSLQTEQGSKILIRDQRARALLAILLRSHKMSRARAWLQATLWDNVGKDESANLRVLLYRLRKDLEGYEQHLVVTKDAVSLHNVSEDIRPINSEQVEFYEDAGYISEGFEDWLRIERSNSEILQNQLQTPALVYQSSATLTARPKITIIPRKSLAIDTRVAVAVEWLIVMLTEQLQSAGMVETVNTRFSDESASPTDLILEIGAVQGKSGTRFDLAAIMSRTGTVCWTTSSEVEDRVILFKDAGELASFVNQTANMIERISYRSMNRSSTFHVSSFEFVSNLISLSKDQVTKSVTDFESAADGRLSQLSAKDLAWLAFGHMILAGESLSEGTQSAHERAEQLLRLGFDLDPTDVVLTFVAAQYEGYVNRDFNLSQEMLIDGLSTAPYSPLLLDTLAMNKLYRGEIKEGVRLAEQAVHFGKFGPLKPYFEVSRIVASSLSGDHEQAVLIGKKVLQARPNFLPVLRHMCASLIELGSIKEAQEILQIAQKLDGGFGTYKMLDDSYPLPSDASREFIIKSLRKAKLLT